MGGVGGFVPYAATASLVASAMSAPPGMQVVTKVPDTARSDHAGTACVCMMLAHAFCVASCCGRDNTR